MIVVINNPGKKKYYGASIAGPVFKEVADQLYAHNPEIHFPASRDTVYPLTPSAKAGKRKEIELLYGELGVNAVTPDPSALWARPTLIRESVSLIPEPVTHGVMPDVTGMGLKDAMYLLEQNGLRVRINGKGSVVSQSIMPGNQVFKGDEVIIVLDVTSVPKRKMEKPEA